MPDTLARATPPPTSDDAPSDPIAFTVHARVADLVDDWRRLEALSGSAYQRHDWNDGWIATAAKAQRVRPALVAGRRGTVVLILPLGVRRTAGVSVGFWLGDEHGRAPAALGDDGPVRGIRRRP